MRTVLMTGGTGFLGLHLLRGHLLAGRKVRLLAHAGGTSALERVRRFLTASGDLDALPFALEERVTTFAIDINLPTLGLSPAETEEAMEGVDEIWHVAATVMLDGREEHVWHTNYTGTENVLRLVARTPAHVLYRHVSTAFVAGCRRHTDAREESSDATTEFENAYERSKHAAEALVRRWATQANRSALIFRPSILVPGVQPQDGLPEHTMHTVGQIVSRIAERRADHRTRLVLRLGADPRAHLNLLQVDWAADTMRALAERVTTEMETVHVVHDEDVTVRALSSALDDIAPVRMRMVPAKPGAPSAEERLFYRRMLGFLPYCYHRRRFDTTKLRTLLPDLPPPPTITREHLARWMQPEPRIAGPDVKPASHLLMAAREQQEAA